VFRFNGQLDSLISERVSSLSDMELEFLLDYTRRNSSEATVPGSRDFVARRTIGRLTSDLVLPSKTLGMYLHVDLFKI
jgi:hypothetical protein